MVDSWSRMLPELLRFSSASQLLEHIDAEIKSHHRPKVAVSIQPVVQKQLQPVKKVTVESLWAGWADRRDPQADLFSTLEDPAGDDLNLSAMGL